MAMAVRLRACPGACVCLLYRPNAEYFISDGLVYVPAVICARMNCGVCVSCVWCVQMRESKGDSYSVLSVTPRRYSL